MSSRLDLLVRGGRLATPDGLEPADLAIAAGRIVRVAPEIADEATATLEAGGLIVFPGIIDAHVHFNEPGRTEWEGLSTGSAALAAGGGSCFFDMPLNSEPPVLDAVRLREKRALAEKKSRLDFALWGGLVPGNLGQLEGLRDAGAIALKAFMCDSGIASFPAVDATALREGMRRAASLGLLVAVHAEDGAAAARLAAELRAAGRTDARAYSESRPVAVELDAIRVALDLAGETGCALHVVHVSSPEGLALIAEGRALGVDVTAETCPHYLLLNDYEVERIGARAKCAPPVRDARRVEELWEGLRSGQVATIGSDHSPAPPEMKTSPDFFEIWGGIAGCQHAFELLFSEAAGNPERDLPLLAAVLARNVARRFGIHRRKGVLAEGLDADFCLVRFDGGRMIGGDELLTRHRLSPYVGRRSHARITDTYVRGVPAWSARGLAAPAPAGRFVRPEI
jgi:allantoinase